MRLVRFEDSGTQIALEFHPKLTMVSGLLDPTRDRLIQSIAGIPRGSEPHCGGIIEVHDARLEFSLESLRLLELNEDIEPVIRRLDLPGYENQVESELGHSDIVSDVQSAAAERVNALLEVDASDAAIRDATSAIAAVQRQLGSLANERADLLTHLEHARGGLDSYAESGLEVVRSEIAEFERRIAAAAGDPFGARRAALETAISELIEQEKHLTTEIDRLHQLDPRPIQDSYSLLDRCLEPQMIPSPEAQALLLEWGQLEDDLTAASDRRATQQAAIDRLATQRDQLRTAVQEADLARHAKKLDQRKVDVLEDLHDEIFELDRTLARKPSNKARRKLDELRAEESALLRDLGFESWSSYILGISSSAALKAREDAFIAARTAYQRADEALRFALADANSNGELSEFQARRNVLQRRTVDLLGGDPGIDSMLALSQLQVPLENPDREIDTQRAAEALRQQLTQTGADLPQEAEDPVFLRAIAQGWIELMETVPQRLGEAEAAHRQLQSELQLADNELQTLPPAPQIVATDSPPDTTEERALLADAYRRLEDCEHRAELHRQSVAAISDFQARVARLDEHDRDLRFTLGERQLRLSDAEFRKTEAANRARALGEIEERNRPTEAEPSSGFGALRNRSNPASSIEALEWYLLARIAQLRNVSFVGSVPLVIDDALIDWHLEEILEVLDRLVRISDVVQVIYLTESAPLLKWANELGASKVAAIELQPAE